MKKLIVSVILTAISFAAIHAQEGSEFRKGKRHHHKMPFQKLNLSEDQKAKFKTLNEGFHKEMQDLKKEDNITVKEWKSRKEKLRNDHKKSTEGLLTNDQKEQLKKMKADRKVQSAARGEKRMDMMKEELALTNEQSAKMKELHSSLSEKMKDIRENKSLEPEQKKEQMKDQMKQNKEKMKSILTDEQLKKLQERKHQKSDKRKVV
jgi:Spy/CpxP family protein refolding chaperone